MRRFARVGVVATAMMLLLAGLRTPLAPSAQAAGAALAGTITSREEAKMEGVVVSARRDGATFTVSVVSDAQGHYAFPRTHLEPGTYNVTIRAAGYELSGPAKVDVKSDSAATLDLALQKTGNLMSQLTSIEIAMSLPPSETADRFVHQRVNCAYCHWYNRIITAKHSPEEWVAVINRMGSYYPDGCASNNEGRASCHKRGWNQDILANNPKWGLGIGNANTMRPGIDKVELGQFLASISMSGGKSELPYRLKALPRPSGKATRVIITQYDLPRKGSVPHEMQLDSKGTPWYTDENMPALGWLDPRSGQFTEYPVAAVPGITDEIYSLRDLTFDPDDNLWTAIRTANGDVLVKYDVKTKQITPVPNFRSTQFITAGDGNIWTAQGFTFARVNPKTMAIEARFDLDKAPNKPEDFCCTYQGVVDAKGNGYIGGNNWVAIIDGKTGATKFTPIPTKFSVPRRGRMDAQGRYWFPEYLGDRVGMYDSKADTVKEWALRKYTTPYATSVPDRKGYVYASSNTTETVIRLDPKTGEIVEYLMPTEFDSKKISVHPAKDHTEIWMANTRTARLVKLEPLD